MRKTLIFFMVSVFLSTQSSAVLLPLVDSGGWASLDYCITTLPGTVTEYQHTHAEAGFDIATGTPVSVDDDYGLPISYAYASTSHSWGQSQADTGTDRLEAANYASADALVTESWGYGSTVYRVNFTLDMEQTIGIGYDFNGYVWVNSLSPDGAGFSTGLLAIEIDNVLVYDSDPEWDDFVEVIGVGYDELTLGDVGTLCPTLAAGPHEIAFFLDTYENAEVPEPATLCLLAFGSLLIGRRKKA
ncbi:MAG: PEP-CTERM sorting domain-containing protein [Sedimentisphaerales bacterium]|nr:PEP-CTERM sorting domain-containing protein [Sedimentisphaerales bacterium]